MTTRGFILFYAFLFNQLTTEYKRHSTHGAMYLFNDFIISMTRFKCVSVIASPSLRFSLHASTANCHRREPVMKLRCLPLLHINPKPNRDFSFFIYASYMLSFFVYTMLESQRGFIQPYAAVSPSTTRASETPHAHFQDQQPQSHSGDRLETPYYSFRRQIVPEQLPHHLLDGT